MPEGNGGNGMIWFSYIVVILIWTSGVLLTAFSPDYFTMVDVGAECALVVVGSLIGLLPVISFTNGLRTGQKSIQKAAAVEGDAVWIAALQNEHFFNQKTLDKLFQEYRAKVQQQRATGQIVSDIDDFINEDVLGVYSWQGVVAQVPGSLTGLGILGTFVGLLMGLENVSFADVRTALTSVETILAGINTAFYTSIAGVILSILFNISNNVMRNVMNREMGMFLENFHKAVLPTAEEQNRYRDHKEVRQIVELLERLPKNGGFSVSRGAQGAMAGAVGNERILMPQILSGLKNNEFIFYLQPRYELSTRKVIGSEALVRWKHPTLGTLSPSVFIPVLESNGYITKLDQYIWESVFQTLRGWIDEGLRPMPISVNVTKTDILAMDVAEFFSDMLKKYRVPPKYISIDIAENAYIETHGAVHDAEARLLQAGFQVVLDGFDGDYIGLSSVEGIGTDVMKLDLRSIKAENKQAALPGIFNQARTLRLTMLVEGIESMEQLTALRKCGCTEGQGYYFSRPLSVEEFEKILKVGQTS